MSDTPETQANAAVAEADRGLVDELTRSVEGLLVPSESDAPIVVSTRAADNAGGYPLGVVLTELGLAGKRLTLVAIPKLLAPYATVESWHEESDKQKVARFVALRDLLMSRLGASCAFQVSEGDITLLLVGQLPSGAWAELKTSLVET